MSPADEERDRIEVSRLLAGAAGAIAKARNCWLATAAWEGGPDLRPMGRLPPEPGDSDWTIRFITDGRSRKASDIRRGGKVALIFQFDADDAFVALSGRATLLEGETEVRRRWKDAYNQFFPTELDRANAAFLKVEAERIELGFAASRPSRSECRRRRSSGTPRAPGA